MVERILFPALFFLCGAFAAFCALKDYPWFMGHRRALLVARVLGHNGTRAFYIILGVGLMAVSAVLFVNGGLGGIDSIGTGGADIAGTTE